MLNKSNGRQRWCGLTAVRIIMRRRTSNEHHVMAIYDNDNGNHHVDAENEEAK